MKGEYSMNKIRSDSEIIEGLNTMLRDPNLKHSYAMIIVDTRCRLVNLQNETNKQHDKKIKDGPVL
jgi:hypothetical protein